MASGNCTEIYGIQINDRFVLMGLADMIYTERK